MMLNFDIVTYSCLFDPFCLRFAGRQTGINCDCESKSGAFLDFPWMTCTSVNSGRRETAGSRLGISWDPRKTRNSRLVWRCLDDLSPYDFNIFQLPCSSPISVSGLSRTSKFTTFPSIFEGCGNSPMSSGISG